MWQPDQKYRHDSRRSYQSGLQRSMWCFKTVTNDEVFVATKSKEKKSYNAWTTNLGFNHVLKTAEDTQLSSDPEMEDEPGPSVFDLARASPSKPRRKPTGRTERADREKFCAKCDVQYKSYMDKNINSWWIGCDATFNEDKCSYWVHATCIGFTNSRESDFSEEQYFYCDEHNEMKQTIENWKDAQKVSKKRRANERC